MRAACLALAIAACAPPPDPGPPPPSRAIGFPDSQPLVRRPVPVGEKGTVVTLLDAGKQPRTELRYRAEVGSRSVTAVHYHIETAYSSREEPNALVPQGKFDLDFTMEVTATSGDDAGNLHIQGRALGMTFTPLDEIARMMVKLPNFQLPEKPEVTATMTPQGELLDVAAGTTMAAQYINLRGLSIPFPREAVGPGARWRVVQHYETPWDIVEDTEVQLVAFDGQRARLTARSRWHQPRQRFRGAQGDLAFPIEADTAWDECVLALDGPALVASGSSSMVMRLPFEAANALMRFTATARFSAP